jgi:DtxR family transcriptional regulator, Mn-dependent transcriptional regulator
MKLSISGQDYLEAIFELYLQKGQIRAVDVSEKLSVTRQSVNRAVNLLKSQGLVTQERYSDIYLTPKGRKAALAVQSKHKVLKEFFINILDISEHTAERDACIIEHSVSAETIEKMQEFLADHFKRQYRR